MWSKLNCGKLTNKHGLWHAFFRISGPNGTPNVSRFFENSCWNDFNVWFPLSAMNLSLVWGTKVDFSEGLVSGNEVRCGTSAVTPHVCLLSLIQSFRFDEYYKCFPVSFIDKPDLEFGDKRTWWIWEGLLIAHELLLFYFLSVVLPPSALDLLSTL